MNILMFFLKDLSTVSINPFSQAPSWAPFAAYFKIQQLPLYGHLQKQLL